MNEERKQIPLLNSILIILHYALGYNFLYPRLLVYLYRNGYIGDGYLVQILIYVFMLVTTVLLAQDFIAYGIRKFMSDVSKNLMIVAKSIARMFLLTIPVSVIIYFISGLSTSSNQSMVDTLKQENMLYLIFASVIFAPIVEEMVFRGSIYNLCKKHVGKLWAMIIASFLFGFLHVYDSLLSGNYADLIYIFLYGGLGFIINMAYENSDSIICAILIHMLNNSLGLFL